MLWRNLHKLSSHALSLTNSRNSSMANDLTPLSGGFPGGLSRRRLCQNPHVQRLTVQRRRSNASFFAVAI